MRPFTGFCNSGGGFSKMTLLSGANSGTIFKMSTSKKILEAMRREPRNVRLADLFKVCVEYFGEPRQKGTIHAIFKTPWPGDPRVNIQNDKGKAKAYQVRQVVLAIDRLKGLVNEARIENE
jgi:hypothetical protein